MTQDDIAGGHVICVVGVAPFKPPEFVVFRVHQKAGGEAAYLNGAVSVLGKAA